MPFHLYKAVSAGAAPRWFGIRVAFDEDRWMATCHEVDADGNEKPGVAAVAPTFYGVTAEQAHRRMLDILENTYDEVTPGVGEGPS